MDRKENETNTVMSCITREYLDIPVNKWNCVY